MSDFLELCDDLDCGVFTGDSLHQKEIRKEFKEYLSRWTRELNNYEEKEEG